MTGDLWLSLVELDPRHRANRAALSDIRARHHIVLAAFPGAPDRQQAGVLYAYNPPTAGQPPRLLVQSATKPDWSHLPAHRTRSIPQVQDIGQFWNQVGVGAQYIFRLTASPCHGVGGDGGNRVRGARTPIKDRTGQIGWLTRVLAGAAELHVGQVTPAHPTGLERFRQQVGRHHGIFDGILDSCAGERGHRVGSVIPVPR